MKQPLSSTKTVRILGIRGVPASHGGFETFADYFSRYLVKKGWDVIVYCQEEGNGTITESQWEGVTRIHIPVSQSGSKGSVVFDGKAALHASKHEGVVLTLGYNTAFFNLLFRLKSIPNLMNMDGIEWKRGKWSLPVRIWFWMNEHIGCHVANHLIADHLEMKRHLKRNVPESKITVSAYGAEEISNADAAPLQQFGIESGSYSTIIARPEPENSILEMVQAFSAKPRNHTLVVLGKYEDDHPYQKSVKAAASDEVKFVGAIYDKSLLATLRYHCRFYMHGHTVGGTNPSLLEALGASNAVIAHNNPFNRWVAADGARYFSDKSECKALLDELLSVGADDKVATLKSASLARFHAAFKWDDILAEQENILLRYVKGLH